MDTGRQSEAEPLWREALEIDRRLFAKNPGAYEHALSTSCNNLALLLKDIGRQREAEPLYREALEIRQRLVKKNPGAYEPDLVISCNNLVISCNNLVILLKQTGRQREAESLEREAQEIRRRLAQKDSSAYNPVRERRCKDTAARRGLPRSKPKPRAHSQKKKGKKPKA